MSKLIDDVVVILWALVVYPVLYVLVNYQLARMQRSTA